MDHKGSALRYDSFVLKFGTINFNFEFVKLEYCI